MGKGTCSVEGCERTHCALGFCKMHWKRFHKHGDTVKRPKGYPARPLRERVDEKIARGGPRACWPWTAANDGHGYGVVALGGGRVGKAHRIVWELTYGPIPAGLFVCHACDNPPCCNPAHLFLGTHTANLRDASNKGRFPKRLGIPRPDLQGERHGMAKLTWEKVAAIRRLRAETGLSHEKIAERFGVNAEAIRQVVLRKSWVNPPEGG